MDLKNYEQAMQKALDFLLREFSGLQVGRATGWLVENLNVDTDYGTMKLNALAHITVMDTTTLKIEPRDKSNAKSITNAIYEANLGVGVDNQGSHILVKIPALTQERREAITKQVKAMGEDTKAQIRLVRQDAMSVSKKLFGDKEISEDAHKVNENNIENLTKKMNLKVDELIKVKSEEVMKL